MRTPHTATHRGRRIRVTLHSGREIYGRFKERTPKWVVLMDGRRIALGDIKGFIQLKGGKTMITLLDVYDPKGSGGIRTGALEFLYQMLEERDPVINISHQAMPSFEAHRQFVTRRPYRCWYIIKRHAEGHEGDAWLGHVYATHANEIGVFLRAPHRGNGFGPEAVRRLMAMHKPTLGSPEQRTIRWLANIAPGNARSHQVFQKLGFRKIQETYALEEEIQHGTDAASPAATA